MDFYPHLEPEDVLTSRELEEYYDSLYEDEYYDVIIDIEINGL